MDGARGDAVGLGDGVGVGVGVADGVAVGVAVADGLAVGVGDGVGDDDGVVDGRTDGETDGATDGVAVGTGVLDGAAVGTAVTAVPPLPLHPAKSPARTIAKARLRREDFDICYSGKSAPGRVLPARPFVTRGFSPVTRGSDSKPAHGSGPDQHRP
jgi:hypothetical protein